MFGRSLKLAGLALVFAGSVAGSERDARADVPPAPGRKRVDYAFSVKGLSVAPDRVLFAYPCGPSNGAPSLESVKLEDGRSVTVGRRGGGCQVYAIGKSAYDAWVAANPSTPGATPHVDALVSQSLKCTGGPSPMFEIASSDPRSAITETFRVTTLDATSCVLTAEPSAGSTPPSTSSPSSSAPPASGASPTKSSGGCSLATHGDAGNSKNASFVFALVWALGTLAARRRSR